MKIVADANIVDVSALYQQYGDLSLLSGRSIGPEDVRDADALLVRSITRVDEALLKNSRVRFVATATSGTDHLDLDFLENAGITVVDAAGSNANAVAEYVLASLARLVLTKPFDLKGKHVAIIGFGHVGRQLYDRLEKLNIPCVLCDPFVAETASDLHFCSLEEALQAPIISLHTPLTKSGLHPTYHMLDKKRLGALAPDTVLINAARGEVVDNEALRQCLAQRRDLLTVLDCWENEPAISTQLLPLVTIATPHIAGYSVEAKRGASERNFLAFLRHFDLRSAGDNTIQAESRSTLVLPATTESDPMRLLAEVLTLAFDLGRIDESLREGGAGAALFDSIRRSISQRREFNHYELNLDAWSEEQKTPALQQQLRALGFTLPTE